ncbi:TPA: InlB B-repeat-containing protein, partial [Streptococcus suis]
MKIHPDKIRRYSIRRLSIGVVSAVTGIFIFGTAPLATAQEIQAKDSVIENISNSQVQSSVPSVPDIVNNELEAEPAPSSLEQTLPEEQLNTADGSILQSESSVSEVQETSETQFELDTLSKTSSEKTQDESLPSMETQESSSRETPQVQETEEVLTAEPSSVPEDNPLDNIKKEALVDKVVSAGAQSRAAAPIEPMALNGEIATLAEPPIPVADGRIAGEVKLLLNSAARGNIKSGYSSQYGGISYADFNNRLVQLIDENGVVVKEVYTNNGDYNFTGLPYGTYTVNVPVDPRYTRILDNTFAHKDYRFEVSLTSTAKQSLSGNVLTLVGRPAKVTMETSVGTYNGSNTLVEYEGGVSQITSVNNNQTYTYIGGPIHTDILGEYLSLLELPTLSQDEINKGYVHTGWYVNGVNDANGQPRLLTQEQVLNLRVPAYDLVIKPAWDRIAHKVTFLTNSDFGSIEQEGVREASGFIEQSEVVGGAPTVISKPGYKFIGWINDLTEEIVTDIANYQVYEPTEFYARYRPLEAHTVTFLTDDTKGTLDGSDNLSLNASDFTSTPTPAEKSGYQFVGWIKDLSGKIYTAEQVANLTPIDQSTTWYASYVQVQEPTDPPLTLEISHAIQVLPEGHPLRDMVVKVPAGTTIEPGTLPTGLTFNQATNTFSGKLPPGQYTIPVTASNNGSTAEAEILIDIFSIPTISVTEGNGETIVTVTQDGQSIDTVIPHGNTITVENRPDGSFDIVITDAKGIEISRENIRDG